MIFFTAIFSFLKKIPTTAWIVLGLLIFFTFAGIYVYNDGYDNGKAASDKIFSEYRLNAEKKINELNNRSVQVTEKVVTEYVDRVKEVTKKEYVYRDVVREIPSVCTGLTRGWVETYNASITDGLTPINPDTLGENSGISDLQALDVIIQNNSIANQNKEQLIALQEWVKSNEALINGTE